MNANETTLDAVNEQGDGVRVGFRRIGDRYAHTLYGVRGGESLAIVESVDDADDQGWPLSLPVQELREATDAASNRTLLLMGAAASGHWSVSVSTTRYGDIAPEFALVFDVAVRLHWTPSYLGAAYDTVQGAEWIDVSDRLAFPKKGKHALCISAFDHTEVEATRDDVVGFLSVDRDRLHPDRRLFLPELPLPIEYPATYRWRYSIASALS
jgi:hypothetical protein